MKSRDKCMVYEYLFRKLQAADNDYQCACEDARSPDVFPSDYSAASVALARKLEIEEIVCDLFNIFKLIDGLENL